MLKVLNVFLKEKNKQVPFLLWVLITFFLSFNSANSQEIVNYESDDYINPVLFNQGMFNGTKKYAFLMSKLQGGDIINYQYRNDFSEPLLAFARSVNNLYYSKYQFNFKIAKFVPLDEVNITNFTSRVQIARYFRSASGRLHGRCQFSWNYYENTNRNLSDDLYSRLYNDFVFDIDIRIADFAKKKFFQAILPESGGLFFSREPFANENFYGIAYRFDLIRFKSASNLQLGMGISRRGYKMKDDWGVLKSELRFQFYLSKMSDLSLNLVGAYSRDLTSSISNIELGVYFDLIAISRFIPKPPSKE